jgi:hypothetical protein
VDDDEDADFKELQVCLGFFFCWVFFGVLLALGSVEDADLEELQAFFLIHMYMQV